MRKRLCELFFIILAGLVLFEIVGQTVVFRHKLYFVNDVDHRMEPHSRIDINGDGIRSLFEADHFRPEDHNILFLGDSYVYGYDLEYSEAPPQRLEAMAREYFPGRTIHVANFGWISSSPLLSLRLLRDIGERYQPDVVLFGLDMSDFEDDPKYTLLLERRGAYRSLHAMPITFLAVKRMFRKIGPLHGLHETFFHYPAKRFFVTDGPKEDHLPYYGIVRNNIDAMAEYSRDVLGAEFVLFLFPRNYQYSDRESPRNWEGRHYENLGPYAHEPFEYFESIRHELDYPVYSLLPDFQRTDAFPTCFERDPHWTPLGAEVAAQAVFRYCVEAGCFGG